MGIRCGLLIEDRSGSGERAKQVRYPPDVRRQVPKQGVVDSRFGGDVPNRCRKKRSSGQPPLGGRESLRIEAEDRIA